MFWTENKCCVHNEGTPRLSDRTKIWLCARFLTWLLPHGLQEVWWNWQTLAFSSDLLYRGYFCVTLWQGSAPRCRPAGTPGPSAAWEFPLSAPPSWKMENQWKASVLQLRAREFVSVQSLLVPSHKQNWVTEIPPLPSSSFLGDSPFKGYFKILDPDRTHPTRRFPGYTTGILLVRVGDFSCHHL